MPIYEFSCGDCGHDFESLQRLNDPLPDACPACGKPNVEKKISAAGFRLKGGGWYETDFKSGAKKNVSGSDSGGSDSGGSDSGGSAGSSASSDSGASSSSASTASDSKSSSGATKSSSTSAKKD